ncbi:MAG TPA: hypothetical protein PLR06_05780 [Cyclobacteriaceae bacterium]|nr:hypothetical protein [Cyclobacteriaceae bacterium]
MIRWQFLFLSAFCILTGKGYCQSINSDTSFVSLAKRNAGAWYEKEMISQSRLYNGTGYREYLSKEDEHPYLIDDWEDGSIVYDGELFTNVPLMLDISDDKVIIEHYSSREKIQLLVDKVSWFTLKNRRFARLDVPSRNGFYEVLHDGTTKVVVKWEKALQTRLSGNAIHMYFLERSFCYILKDNIYYPVKSKKSVLTVLSDHKSELNKFISKNKLDFRIDREKNIARITEYYDSLSK